MNISRTGAQIGIERPLKLGDAAFLQIAALDQFGTVVRQQRGVNALEFDVELSDDEVLAIRHFSESFEDHERAALRKNVRDWVSGVGDG